MSKEQLTIIQIARRFGPVGGMERYAWEVSRELKALGHHVIVLCERCHAEKPTGMKVVELGEVAMRPRWLAQVRFARRVREWLRQNPQPGALIHSHERVDVHDVTTFHGPPFANILDRPFWRRLSFRVAMRLFLERRELRIAQAIVPNSRFIADQLEHYYPEYAAKLTSPILPGVETGAIRAARRVPSGGGVVCFVGLEWERKGLQFAVDIVKELRRERSELELWVVGPPPEQVQHLFATWEGGYRLLGFCKDNEYFTGADVMLHPAKAEPYGMVIAEAMAAQVPVVISDVCGAAADVGAASGRVLSLQSSLQEWVAAVDQQLQRCDAPPAYHRSWREVALEHEALYRDMRGKL
ncbi:MAG: glycosyltransferase family 4 protein [Gallionella sp.]